ncbi:MAG: hypothetical protein ACI4XP_11450 [Acutalibacteraceae bacterium]
MKKKGLIISTVVMVVVLIASLTTATYAWFTTTASTSIEGFAVSVAAGNVMNIGLNKQGYTSYNASATADSFVSGNCEYQSDSTAGQFAAGYWTGEVESLGSTITHNIMWGDQEKAVGFSSDAAVGDSAANATFANTKLITQPSWTHAVKANGDSTKFTGVAEYANANVTSDGKAGDFVYMFLGAQPTKAIQTNTNRLYVVIQPQGNGTTNGIAAAIHVAYKVNAAENWTDVDFSEVAEQDHKSYSQPRNGNSAVIYGDYHSADGFTGGSYDSDTLQTIFTGAVVVPITLSEWNGTGSAPLDQIQLVIYLAGADSDCVDAAKNGMVRIGLFFGAQEVQTP